MLGILGAGWYWLTTATPVKVSPLWMGVGFGIVYLSIRRTGKELVRLIEDLNDRVEELERRD